MKCVCAWCGKDLGEREPLEADVTTHGICGGCFDSMDPQGKGGQGFMEERDPFLPEVSDGFA